MNIKPVTQATVDFFLKPNAHINKLGSMNRRTPQAISETDCSENPSGFTHADISGAGTM
jgi:hypothetical protein